MVLSSMAISSLAGLCITALLVIPFYFFTQQWAGSIATIPKGFSMEEEKNRLGSTPPTCYHRCHNCLPCIAVQVLTPPAHDGVRPGPQSSDMMPSATKKYTNYKPLGWKCRCGNHLFNP